MIKMPFVVSTDFDVVQFDNSTCEIPSPKSGWSFFLEDLKKKKKD